MPKNFAIIGVAGYIAPRHLRAIRDTGNVLVAATDPKDSVGVLDQFSFDIRYFPEIERFDRHLEKLRRGPAENRVHMVSICSPNYLHDAHIRLALRIGADVICEKPLVISPWNLDPLQELEHESGRKINTVLQLRVHPAILAVKQALGAPRSKSKHEVLLTYITGRGNWYGVSWKGSDERSGGLASNIGVHFFDLLLWLFGKAQSLEVHLRDPKRLAGFLELERANVRWFLSTDIADLPFKAAPGTKTTFRSLKIDGNELEFTEGFADLHTRVYEQALAGHGFGIDDARASIELTHKIRVAQTTVGNGQRHPLLSQEHHRAEHL
jgi:UDP-N-acetyl-2-amino-2-deoxyglucuronate dehydrogenase